LEKSNEKKITVKFQTPEVAITPSDGWELAYNIEIKIKKEE